MSVASEYQQPDSTHDVAADVQAEFGRPVVFGSAERPLSGRLHEPPDPAIGAVVLFSPIGYEENCAFYAFQLLARRLAQSGYATLRFDYDGCGNSWGDSADPDRIGCWTASCCAAIDFMGERTGQRVHVVGLRLGATLALTVGSQYRLNRTVFWDPVVSGRRYLRVLRAMSMMGVEAAPDPKDPGSLVVIGHYLDAKTVRSLEELECRSLVAPAISDALIVGRPHSSDPARLAEMLGGQGIPVVTEEIAGTAELLDCAAEQAVVPHAIIERIHNYLIATPGAPAKTRATLPPFPALVAPVVPGWTEHHLSIGPRGLAGVLTLPRNSRRAGVVVMANNGVARSIGPARAWVAWARQWASIGIASLRFDLSGIGDSNPQNGAGPGAGYPIQAIEDFRTVIGELRQRGLTPAVAVGLCSGAFLSLDAAAANAGFTGIVSINPQLFYLPDAPGSADRLLRAAPPTHPWVQRFLENTRVGRRLAKELPYPAWWVLDRLGLQPAPIRGAVAASARARVLLIFGEDNLGLRNLRRRTSSRILREWRESGRMIIVPGLDHSMFAPQAREPAESITRNFLLEMLPPVTANRLTAVD